MDFETSQKVWSLNCLINTKRVNLLMKQYSGSSHVKIDNVDQRKLSSYKTWVIKYSPELWWANV